MIITAKDALKLIGIVIVCACAAFVCLLFVNYAMDLSAIEGTVTDGLSRVLYDAQVAQSKVICAICGSVLLSLAAVILFFYIGRYVDSHKKELGALKALGYSRFQISRSFWLFGLNVLAGTGLGCIAAFIAMPTFYEVMNEDGFFLDFSPAFHPELLVYICVLPAIVFAIIAVQFAANRLKLPATFLLRSITPPSKASPSKRRDDSAPFLVSLRHSTIRSSKALVFFMFIGAFCFAAMIQMSASMSELSSEWMGAMIFVIGIILGATCLLLSISSLVRRFAPAAAIMHALGYSHGECTRALLGGFRPYALMGFAAGTVYQFVLLEIILNAFFSDFTNLPEHTFDVPVLVITFISFVVFYEATCALSARHLSDVRLRDLATE